MTDPSRIGPAKDDPAAARPDEIMTQTDYQRVQDSPEFQDLRRRFRRFVFPMTAFFLLWYVVYVLLADYAQDFMSTPVWGTINVGLVLGLSQFVTTFAITMTYASWANKRQDPIANELRQRIEGQDLV
ncbi:uncharacterized membrane protein (DUF485 family) [Sanguibacter antarcticus]|uniref:Uncharacterized membrane protein (DUF485 family) n=2 Tax=Sanguibacter antarcticus TaxID=372484 RepID=A0A2A9E3H0_9MICO|nr:uncharacterized membrane protein (DUF485 family) [Sanguibacter antarcticus]